MGKRETSPLKYAPKYPRTHTHKHPLPTQTRIHARMTGASIARENAAGNRHRTGPLDVGRPQRLALLKSPLYSGCHSKHTRALTFEIFFFCVSGSLRLYPGCLGVASSSTRMQTVPATIDFQLACRIRTKAVGDARAGTILCHLQDTEGEPTLVMSPPPHQTSPPPHQTAEASHTSSTFPDWGRGAEAEGGGPGAGEGKGAEALREHLMLRHQNLIFGSITAQALMSALSRRGYRLG